MSENKLNGNIDSEIYKINFILMLNESQEVTDLVGMSLDDFPAMQSDFEPAYIKQLDQEFLNFDHTSEEIGKNRHILRNLSAKNDLDDIDEIIGKEDGSE